jgi:restriction system protein
MANETKFCEFCGNEVHIDAVMCPKCGRQLEELKTDKGSNPQVVINNNNQINGAAAIGRRECDKWIAFLLCFFLGLLGGHKFYEGKVGLGILYIFTVGLFGIGWFIDLIVILCRPNPYFV